MLAQLGVSLIHSFHHFKYILGFLAISNVVNIGHNDNFKPALQLVLHSGGVSNYGPNDSLHLKFEIGFSEILNRVLLDSSTLLVTLIGSTEVKKLPVLEAAERGAAVPMLFPYCGHVTRLGYLRVDVCCVIFIT